MYLKELNILFHDYIKSTDGANKLNRTFSYDPLYRLLSATGRESDTQEQNDYLYADAPIPGSPNANNVRAYTRKYTYDKIGNILKMQQIASGNSFTRNFVYNTGVNTLQKIETGSSATIEAFTYDPCGNQLTAGTSRHYAWDAANQLQVYKNQAGSSNPTVFAQYQYAGGSRVSKMVRTGTDVSPIYERIIYIDGVFEYHKLENGSTYEKNYVHVMDDASRICTVRINVPSQTYPGDISESITYILEDQIGSSVARLKTDGSVIDKEEYYPFGDSSLRTFTKKSYRYVGKEKDAESGLYYYGARYYAAWTCRFISIDPLASDYPFYTPYNYAGNKPINKIDIDGMQESGNPGNTETQNNNNDTTSTPQSAQNPLSGKVHFIDEISGKHLGTIDFEGIEGESIKATSSENYNNLSENSQTELLEKSKPVRIDTETIKEAIKEVSALKKNDKGNYYEHTTMLFTYDRTDPLDLKISAQTYTDSSNTENESQTPISKYENVEKNYTMAGHPAKIIIGQMHPHPPTPYNMENTRTMGSSKYSTLNDNTKDINFMKASKAPVYFVAQFQDNSLNGKNPERVGIYQVQSNKVDNLFNVLNNPNTFINNIVQRNR